MSRYAPRNLFASLPTRLDDAAQARSRRFDQCARRAHALGQRHWAVGYAQHGVDTQCKYIVRTLSQAARQAEHGYAELLCAAGDADRCLAECRLEVGAAFASDDEVDILDDLGKPDSMKHDVDTGLELRRREEQQAGAEPAGGTRTGVFGNVAARGTLRDGGIMRKRGIEFLDHRRRGAFLRAKHG